MSYKKSEQTRQKILDAAYECFASDGLARTSLGSIARRCELSASHVLYHYHHIDELFLQVVKSVFAVASEILDRYTSQTKAGEESLNALVDGMFDWMVLDAQRQSLVIQFYHECLFKPEFRKLHSAVVKLSVDRAEQILAASPLAASEQRVVAESIQNMISGTLIKIACYEDRDRIPQLRQNTKRQALKIASFT